MTPNFNADMKQQMLMIYAADKIRREDYIAEFKVRPDPLWELAREYSIRTELYDRLICTGGEGRDGIMPATPRESSLINRFAQSMRHDLFRRLSPEVKVGFMEWRRAMRVYGESEQAARDLADMRSGRMTEYKPVT